MMKENSHNLLGLWHQFMWHVWRTLTVYYVFMVYYPGCAQEQNMPWFTFEHFCHVLTFQLVTVWKGQKILALRGFQLWCFIRSKFIDVHYICMIHCKKFFYWKYFYSKILFLEIRRRFYSTLYVLSSAMNPGYWVQFCFCNCVNDK